MSPPMPDRRAAPARSKARICACSTSGCPIPTASRCCANGRAGQGLDFPVVMMSGHGTVETAVEATRLGAFDFVEKPLSLAKLLRTVERALDIGRLASNRRAPRCRRCSRRSARAARCSALREQVHAGRAARGTGADHRRARHRPRSLRALRARAQRARGQALRQRRCRQSLRRNRGDATARQRHRQGREPGLLRASRRRDAVHQWTRRSVRAGPALLAVGPREPAASHVSAGSQPVPLDLRVVSSAQPGLEQRTTPEPFRRDLLSQLNVLTLRIPPLREYAEDVPELLRHYVDRLADAERTAVAPLQRRGAESAAQLSVAGQCPGAAQSRAAAADSRRHRGHHARGDRARDFARSRPKPNRS